MAVDFLVLLPLDRERDSLGLEPGGGINYRRMSEAIHLSHEVGEGKDREIHVLLADRWRKLVLIQLRRGVLLADHSARVPITIHTVAGTGTLRVGSEEHALLPGVVVPVDAHTVHNVQADPAVAILVSFFRHGEARDENDTTASFD
jgi:quercetin dioxygenase-like cupin family protein